jgi:ribonuclease-3
LDGRIPPKASKSERIANLIDTLNEALDEDSAEEVMYSIGKETFNQCLELRSLLKKRVNPEAPPIKTPPASQTQPPDAPSLPKSLSALSVTPWKSSEIPHQLPPLPKVLDPTLETAAFTHQGMGVGRVTDLSYERLEWVGDAYLYLTSTLLISQTFPTLLPGKCSQLRERLVKNITLSDYARQYGFEKRSKLPNDLLGNSKHPAKDQDLVKIMGDIFEAYVAAVILSDPKDGVTRVTDWLKKLWSITLKKEIINEEKSGMKFDSPMWRLRGDVGKIEIVSSAPPQLGPKEQLQKILGSKGIRLTYKDAAAEKKDKTNKLPLFTVGVYLDGYGHKDKQLGFGTANGKKDAGNKAAAMALANKNMMKELTDRKRMHDAQLEREREALEGIGGI